MTITAPSTATTAGVSQSRPEHSGRVAAELVMLVGLGLVATTLMSNLFVIGPAFENLITAFRPALTQSSIDTAHKDIAGLSAVQQEFSTKLEPALSQRLNMTPKQFNGFVSKSFPAVAAGVSALPAAVPTFNGMINTLDKQRPLFASADAIPTESLPATTVPWALLGAGILLFLIGLTMLRSPKTGAAAAVVVGLVLLVLPMVLSLPAKAGDADQLNANLKPFYTQALLEDATGALGTIGAMGAEMQSTMLPELATQLKISPEQLQTFLGSNVPATAQALQTMPATTERFDGLVKVFDNNLGNYETVKPMELERLILIMMGAGALVALLGGLTVVTARKK